MSGNIYLTVAISLMAAGCSTTRTAIASHTASAQVSEIRRIEQADRQTVLQNERHADTETVVTTTIDEYDTTHAADPVIGTPPLKRREITMTQTRAWETATARAASTEQANATTETKAEAHTETAQETVAETKPATSRWWLWFKIGFGTALALAVVAWIIARKITIKNLLKSI